MADFAHEVSGPASSEPSGIALQQASPASSDRGKLRVFISYSRDDLKFADQLDVALSAYGFECLIDRHGISGGEDWKRRLGNLISEADTVVFVLSPSSARSEICDWEVAEAARLNKRILPIVCRPLEGVSTPPRLGERNYIFFYEEPKLPSSGFGTGLASLITALNSDFEWLREHTRYLQRAMEWHAGGRPKDRLLSGNDILEAKGWASRRPKGAPEPTALHLEFIRASEEEAETRLSEQRKQLDAMAAAQAEREKALHEAERALKQAADAQRTRARIRNIALVVVSVLAVLAGWLGWDAEQQRNLAEQRRITAEEQTILAEQQRARAEEQKTIAEQQQKAAEEQTILAEQQRARAEEQKTIAEQQQKTAEEQRQQADAILARATKIIVTLEKPDTKMENEAVALFQTGAEHGDATSMRNLGVAYESGLGGTRDQARALEWYEKAAAKGDLESVRALARLYGNAAAEAQIKLYENAAGEIPNYAKAREWYEKAAATGDVSILVPLGRLYEDGKGGAPDHAKAGELFEKARQLFEKKVAEGHAQSMIELGDLYRDGLGVTQDCAKARGLYQKAAAKAAANGDKGSKQLAESFVGGLPFLCKSRRKEFGISR